MFNLLRFLLFFVLCCLFVIIHCLYFFAQAIEKAEANVAWMEANYQPIWSWLKKQNKVQDMVFAKKHTKQSFKEEEKLCKGVKLP